MRQDGRGGQQTEVAILNEPQSIFLLTYMRNNDVVRQFKKALVRAFFEMLDRLQQRKVDIGSVSEQGQANRLVNAGRMFREVTRLAGIANRANLNTLALANNVTAEATGIDLLGLMERAGWQAPARRSAEQLAEVTRQLSEWLEAQGGDAYTSDQLMKEALGIADPKPGDPTYGLLSATMQSLGWRPQRMRTPQGQYQGYRKKIKH